MIFDFKSSHPVDGTVYDYCIAGAGPAGITLALKLSANGSRVALFEGGDFYYTNESQSLYECHSTALETWPMHMRLRYFGGTSNHWAGRCKPFTEHDFEPTTLENGLPGWPIRYAEVKPYLNDAKAILDIGDQAFAPNADSPPNLGEQFYPDYFALSPPTRFGPKYRPALESSSLIDVFVNANLVDIRLAEDLSTVDHVIIKGYDGRQQAVHARRFILALGGMENPRLLLNCDSQLKDGIGNQGGMVGKCFMEHFNIHLGSFLLFDDSAGERFEYHSTTHLCDQQKIGKGNIAFYRVAQTEASGRTAAAKELLQSAACRAGLEDRLRFMLEFDCPGELKLSTLIEQMPNLDSNITLSSDTDALGLRRGVMNWTMCERDRRTVRVMALELAKEFARADMGRLKLKEFVLDESLEIPTQPHSHHMGTTRMSDDPRHGVVDKNCRVHGTQNLYIAGCSVFATGGVNPTMPLIQFALRLADHLNPQTA